MSRDAEERVGFLQDDPYSSSPTSPTLGGVEPKHAPLRRLPWPTRIRSLCRSLWRSQRRSFRIARYFLIACLAIFIATPFLAPSYTQPPAHYRELAARCSGPSANIHGCANPFNEKVFISVSLYDKNGHLASGQWGESLLELIDLIGNDNVFLSIYENDSGTKGEQALIGLQKRLRCRSKVVNDAHVPMSEFPTLKMPDGTDRTKRLAYLSEMRNRALRPLDTFDQELGIQKYDKVLFLNDVSFHPVEAAQLLFSTNADASGRAQYLFTCSLDFIQPFKFYDLYAQRDAEGFSGGLPLFPFFSTEGNAISRKAVLAQKDAVPVKSCWGGMVAMQAEYVQNMKPELPSPDFQAVGSHVINPAAPANVTAPVRFRYEPEIFYDACECCLLLADVTQAAKKQGATELGTYVNPYIRVAYSQGVLNWIPVVKRWEKLLTLPHWFISKLVGLPTHNPHRTVQEGDTFMEEVFNVHAGGSKVGQWQMVERPGRNGMFCGVREMQLIKQSKRIGDGNWENTKMPAGQRLDFPT